MVLILQPRIILILNLFLYIPLCKYYKNIYFSESIVQNFLAKRTNNLYLAIISFRCSVLRFSAEHAVFIYKSQIATPLLYRSNGFLSPEPIYEIDRLLKHQKINRQSSTVLFQHIDPKDINYQFKLLDWI